MRNVRNFWLNLRVDGRSTTVETGPASATGGMRGTISQRHQGTVADATLDIECNGTGTTLRTFVTVRGQLDADPERGPFAYALKRDGTRVPLDSGDAIVLETLRY